jgi:hypothetical protein
VNRLAIVMLALAALLLVRPGLVSAQEATPATAGTPSGIFGFPDPSECTVAPKTIPVLQSILATPVAATPAATPVASGMPAGAPADAQTVTEIEAALHEAVACINTGDILKVIQFYSDDLLRRLFAGYPVEQLLPGTPGAGTPVVGTPEPLNEGQQTELIAISGMVVLPDGRVAVVVTGDDHSNTAPASDTLFYWVKVGDKWLIDDFVTDVNVATPTP